MTAIDREALETERDFLLRSLDDLEDERAAGNVDPGTYRELHDDYTARAAALIRALDAGTEVTGPEPEPVSALRRALTVGGILAFAVVAAVLLSHAVGQRHPGQTITGNGQIASGPTSTTVSTGAELAAEVKRAPRSYAAHIAYARYLLGTNAFSDAVKEFGTAARLDPKQPEPSTYEGWAGALVFAAGSRRVRSPDPALGLARAHQRRDQGASEVSRRVRAQGCHPVRLREQAS